jgi:hypothetical protein
MAGQRVAVYIPLNIIGSYTKLAPLVSSSTTRLRLHNL